VAGLKWLPYGGLYLTGGLTPKNLALLKDPQGPFLSALLDKGRVSGMLHSIPIYAVTVEDLGERGAKYMALYLLQQDVLRSRSTQSAGQAWDGWTLSLTAGLVGASATIFALAVLKKLKL
jgi:hypothetical protein